MSVILTLNVLKCGAGMYQIIVKWNLVRTLLLIASCFITSCAFYPTTSKQQYNADNCSMATRSLDLDYEEMSPSACNGLGHEGGALCLAALGVVIPVGSFVASGSIVLTGNTLHWLEYHGTCDDGLLWSYIDGSKK